MSARLYLLLCRFEAEDELTVFYPAGDGFHWAVNNKTYDEGVVHQKYFTHDPVCFEQTMSKCMQMRSNTMYLIIEQELRHRLVEAHACFHDGSKDAALRKLVDGWLRETYISDTYNYSMHER